jgi:hypothetical protein
MTDLGFRTSPLGFIQALAARCNLNIQFAMNELVEDSIADSSVGADKLVIIFAPHLYRLIMMNNGAGLTEDRMKEALVFAGNGHPDGRGPSDKRSGTYHTGMWTATAFILSAMDPARDGVRNWISRHTESTEDFKTATADTQMTEREKMGWWADRQGDFTQSIVNPSLLKETDSTSGAAVKTRPFAVTSELKTWCAVAEGEFDEHKTGSLIMFEGIKQRRIKELNDAFNSPDINENYIVQLMRKYCILLNQGKQIIINQLGEDGSVTRKINVPKPVDIAELFKDNIEENKPIITEWVFMDIGDQAAKDLFKEIKYTAPSKKRKISNYLVHELGTDKYWMCTASGSKRGVWLLPENARRYLKEKIEMKGDEHDIYVKTTCYWSADGKILQTYRTAYESKLEEMGVDTKMDKEDFCRAIVGNSVERSNVRGLIGKTNCARLGGGPRQPKAIVDQTSIEYKIKSTRDMDEKWGIGPNKSADAGSEGRDPNLQLVMEMFESRIHIDKIIKRRKIKKNKGTEPLRLTKTAGIIYPCEDTPYVRGAEECLCGKWWKTKIERDNCECCADAGVNADAGVSADADVSADAVCSCDGCKNIGIACPCGECDSHRCVDCDATSAGFWRCGAEKEIKGFCLLDDSDDDEEEEGSAAAAAEKDEEDEEEGGEEEGDEEEEEEEDDDEEVGGTHGVAGYDAHNGLEKEDCLDCLKFLSKINPDDYNKCINGEHGVMEGLERIHNIVISANESAHLAKQWKEVVKRLGFSFKQYLISIEFWIEVSENKRPRGGAALHKLVQYFKEH